MTPHHIFRPVILGPTHRWHTTSFDLKFDAKWTHQPGSVVHMAPNETISVSVVDRQKTLNGMRFATGSEWIAVASGKKLRISLTTKAESKSCAYRTVYIPQDVAHSGFHFAEANTESSTFFFDFALPGGSEAPTHFVVIEPQADDVAIEVLDAKIEVL